MVDFHQPETNSHWFWPAIIVSMATFFVVMLVTTVLVWMLRPSRAEPDVAEGWSPAEHAGEMIPSGDHESSGVSPSESSTEPPSNAAAHVQEPEPAPADSADAPPVTSSQVGAIREPGAARNVVPLQPDAQSMNRLSVTQRPAAPRSPSPWKECRSPIRKLSPTRYRS